MNASLPAHELFASAYLGYAGGNQGLERYT